MAVTLRDWPTGRSLRERPNLLTLGLSFGIFTPVAIVRTCLSTGRILSLDTKVAIEDAPIDPLSPERGNGMRFYEYRGRMRQSPHLGETLNHERFLKTVDVVSPRFLGAHSYLLTAI